MYINYWALVPSPKAYGFNSAKDLLQDIKFKMKGIPLICGFVLFCHWLFFCHTILIFLWIRQRIILLLPYETHRSVYRCPVVSWGSLHLHPNGKPAGEHTPDLYRFLRSSMFRVSSSENTAKYPTNNISRPQGRDLVWRGVKNMWARRNGSLALYHAWSQKAA